MSLIRSNVPRLPPDEQAQLIAGEWAPHERKMYCLAQMRPGSPPKWDTELVSHPDGGPSDTAHARLNRNRVVDEPDRDPNADLAAINQALCDDEFRFAPAEGAGALLAPDAVPPGLLSLWRRSEMRTPLIVPAPLAGSYKDAIRGITELAKRRKTRALPPLYSKDATAGDIEHGCSEALDNGKWLIIVRDGVAPGRNGDMPDSGLFRHAALQLLTVMNDAEMYPKRELFRLWVVVEETVDLNETNCPLFPTLFSHQALQLCPEDDGATKVVRKLPADPQLQEDELRHRRRRAEQGRPEDGESLEGDAVDDSCSPRKLTGPLFVRAHEMQVHTSPERARDRLAFAAALR